MTDNIIYKLTCSFLDRCVGELNKEDNKKKINDNIIDPFIKDLLTRLYPYIMIIGSMYILILILILAILLTLVFKKK